MKSEKLGKYLSVTCNNYFAANTKMHVKYAFYISPFKLFAALHFIIRMFHVAFPFKLQLNWHTEKAGLWTHGLDAWTLNDWKLGRLGSERLDSVQLDAWTLEPWIQKIISVFSDIYYFLIISYCRILKHFERSMTNVLWLC